MENVRTYPQTAMPDIAQRQNRVLRNTYALLALSMAPTVAGALIGIQLKFSFLAGSPFIAFMLFLGVAFGFMWGIERTKNSGMGVALLLGFTFFMGLMLSRILQVALGFSNGGSLIAMAAGRNRGDLRLAGGRRFHHQAGFLQSRQIPVFRRDPAAGRHRGQHLFPDPGLVAGDFGHRRGPLLRLHPV
jgi:hypothetical protein